MRRSFLFSVLLLVSLLSCQQDNYADIRSFSSFFSKFNTDSNFQAKHTQFPLICFLHDVDAPMMEYAVDETDWTPILFPLDAVAVRYNPISDHTMSVSVEYPDTGVMYILVFRYYQNMWHLTDTIDVSD